LRSQAGSDVRNWQRCRILMAICCQIDIGS
jgi:hypothetical protein